ncbi:MAG: hypothetical protein ABUJ92_00270 [Desulfobacterales bacterium]
MKTNKEMRAVMKAHDDGKKIGYRRLPDMGLSPVSTPVWNWDDFDYEEVREPKTIFANEYEGVVYAYDSEEIASKCAGSNATRIAVEYKEVIK